MDTDVVLERLWAEADPGDRVALAHIGIHTDRALGVRVPRLREWAWELGTDHELALGLWGSEIREARLLATMVADAARVDAALMEKWAAELDSWDLADQAAGNLFWRTEPAWEKAAEWAGREAELVRRTGFSLMAALALHSEDAPEARFEACFSLIEEAAADPRERVRKAVSWALRQIGKRSLALNERALSTARGLQEPETRPAEARKLGLAAERELASETVQQRLAGPSG